MNLVAQSPDWELFLSLGAEHRVLSLVYTSLKTAADIFPREVWDKIKAHYLDNVRNIMALTNQTQELLQLFETGGIEVIPYKGLSLAKQAYADDTAREIQDIDVVVHQHDLSGIHALLENNGYHGVDGLASPLTYLRTHHSAYLRSNRLIEIHWRFLPDLLLLKPSAVWLWQNTLQDKIGTVQTRKLAPEEMLVLLCAHGTSHWWLRLSHVCDVAELIRSTPTMDWAAVLSRAKHGHVQRMLNIGLLVTSQLLQAPIPDTILNQIEQDQVESNVANEICRNFFDRPSDGRYRDVSEITKNLQVRDRLIDRAVYLFQYAVIGEFSQQDRDWLPLPRQLSFLYYLLRPIRLVVQYGWRLVRQR